ncbi:hypothetical protein IQ06DRAFT_52279 [Phaeosphaeriaceae sp. SRC1lsM3a]|nr:hypothetical protein IQ06DRAFT_52279 [Stagonospora sp. SRC1lsM3a]
MTNHPSSTSPSDTYIPYGRGGAGNMRRKSSISAAWSLLSTQPSHTLVSSPDDHYASSKTEQHRRRSSTWSSSTSGGEHRSRWRRLSAVFSRRRSEDAGVLEKAEEDEKIEKKVADGE